MNLYLLRVLPANRDLSGLIAQKPNLIEERVSIRLVSEQDTSKVVAKAHKSGEPIPDDSDSRSLQKC